MAFHTTGPRSTADCLACTSFLPDPVPCQGPAPNCRSRGRARIYKHPAAATVFSTTIFCCCRAASLLQTTFDFDLMDKPRRRRHVPAFGEWNYYSSPSASPDEPAPPHSGAAAAEPWGWYAPEEPEACSDAWFRYSPPPRRRLPAPKKARRPETAGGGVVAVAAAAEHKRAVAPAGRAPGKGAGRSVVVRPVDEDLYRVPPPDGHTAVSGLPRRRKRAARRSLWMGCLGIN